MTSLYRLLSPQPVSRMSKPFIQGFLQPHSIRGLLTLSGLQTVSFFGIETDWNQSLAFKMAKSWTNARNICFTTYNNTDPLCGLWTEVGHYMDIRDLIHFAKYCPRLGYLSLPLSSLFQFGEDIAARYKLNAKGENCIFVDDQNTYYINNLAMADFLYNLFGRRVYTQLQLGHSLYRALRVYGGGGEENDGSSMDYNS